MDWIGKLLGIDGARLGEGEKSLEWYDMPELWVVVLVIIPAIVILVSALYRKDRKDAPPAAKALLVSLRALLLLLVLLMIFRPVLTSEKIYHKRSHVILLIDESLSMGLSDALSDKEVALAVAKATGIVANPNAGELTPREEEAVRALSRIDIVNRLLANPTLRIVDRLNEKLVVQTFAFSDKIRGDTAIGAVRPSGGLTAIGDAILGALNMMRDRFVAAVIVISDGRNNHGRDPIDVARLLGSRHIPIYTVAPGASQPVKDVELLEPEAKEVARANDIVDIDFKLRNRGFAGENVEIVLTEVKLENRSVRLSMDPAKVEERIATGKRAQAIQPQLKGEDEKQAERISYKPEKPGEYELILSATAKSGEITPGNNYLSHRVRVIDDKIRVLYVEYPPRFEYRFLKNAMVRDASLQVRCLLLSADSDFPQESTPGLEPIREFPATMTELMQYDVLVFGDVNPADLAAGGFDAEAIERNVEAFVAEFGGGVIFIAGVKDNPSSFLGKKFASMLPVIPEGVYEKTEEGKSQGTAVGYRLTDEGKGHPITRLLPDPAENLDLWEDRDRSGDGLMGIFWASSARKVKPTATVLVTTEDAPGMERRPLFVSMPYGTGRVFYSATDDTWRWRHLVGDRFFFTFWRQAIEWAMEGKLRGTSRFRLQADRERYAIGETVTLIANAYTANFEPLEEDELEINVEPPEGERARISLRRVKGGKSGAYSGTFTPRETGHFNVWVGEEDEASRAIDHFSVFMPNRETDDPTLDIATLRRMAEEAGGKENFFPIGDVAKLPDSVRKIEHVLSEVNEDDIWDSPLAYLLFAILITTEWIVRKMNRML